MMSTAGSRPADRPALRESARCVALAAAREASTRCSRTDAARALEAPSAELVRLVEYLRSTVGRYVGTRRAAGLPVERVLVETKSLVREASALEGWFDTNDALMAQVVRWTIEAYYVEPGRPHVQ